MTKTTMDQKEVARDRKDHKEVRNTADLRGNKKARKTTKPRGAPAKTWPAG